MLSGNLDCFSGGELTIRREGLGISISGPSEDSKLYGLLMYVLGRGGAGSFTVEGLLPMGPSVQLEINALGYGFGDSSVTIPLIGYERYQFLRYRERTDRRDCEQTVDEA